MNLLHLLLLTSSTALCDYNSDLNRIQDRGAQIDRALSSFGVTNSSSTSGTNNSPDEQRPIITVHNSASSLRAETGRVLNAELLMRLVVGGEPSPVIIKIVQASGLFSNLKILGHAHQGATDGRIQIEFDRVVFNGGRSQTIKAYALGDDKAYGLRAQVLSSKALMIGGAMASSFISGYTASQQTQNTSAFGFTQTQPTSRNGILQGVAQTAADQSKRLIEDATKEQPVLVAEAGSKLFVFFDEEVRF